ncbi:MAG: glycosyltransferase family 4 protein [Planctomycetota bacterium]|nr:glycosyltransferase family 4 protein [Planctomycetota bacterium]
MNLLMVSGDRQVVIGERGPFWSMQRHFSTFFDRVDVLVPGPGAEVVTRSIHGNVHFHVGPPGRRALPGWIASRGAALVQEHGHGLAVTHDYGTFYNGRGGARLARAAGIPLVSELHHIPGHPVASGVTERLEKLMARLYVGWARRHVRAFRVVNESEMPALLRRWGVPDEQIVVLPSQYLDFDVFHPPAQVQEPQRDVVFVGRMAANKGVERILDALARCASRGSSYRATFVGKGPERERWIARAARLGLADRTEWIEWIAEPSELAEIYRTSRVCVCASTCEGGPRFTVEAMASGVTVVSTPVGVMTDLLADGEAGRLAGFDVDSLADALTDVLCDETRRVQRGVEAARRVQVFEYHAALERYARGLIALAGAPEADG